MPSFLITEIPVGYAGHIPSAVFIDDEGVLKYESGTICDYAVAVETLDQAPQAVCLADDGWMHWHSGYRDNIKYGSLDKKVPLTLQTLADIPAVNSFSVDLYLCPLGYLRSTQVGLQVDSPVASLREALKIASTDCVALTVASDFAEFAESWYIMRPKGYLCRIPFQEPAQKLQVEDIPFGNLNSGGVNVDKSPAWSEARDQYYLSRYPWGAMEAYDRLLSTGAGQLPSKDRDGGSGWNEIYPYDYLTAYPWTVTDACDREAAAKYMLILEHKDFRSDAPWGTSDFYGILTRHPWRPVHGSDRYVEITAGGEICYLMPWVVSSLPAGSNLAFDLTEQMDFKRFYEIVRYPTFDTFHTPATAILFDDANQTIYHDQWQKQPKLPAVSNVPHSSAVYVSDTGFSWIDDATLGYYELEGSSHVEFMDSSSFGTADPVLDDPLRRTIMIPSPGCYPRTTDNYPNPPDDPVIVIIIDPLIVERSLNIMSSATLVRASDGAIIPVTSMGLTTDIQSWCWSFNATVKTQAGLDLCKPVSADPVELIATINGTVFTVLIDGYSERASFGKTGFSISGRTRAVELASPMAAQGSAAYAAAMNLSQIFDTELLRVQGNYSGNWTGIWSAQDGLIPANTFAYQDKTPIEAIALLAGSVGGFIYHDLDSRTLRVAKVYKKNPWDFLQGDEDLALHPSTVISTGMQWKPTPVKNGIYVSGTTANGYLCKVAINGTDGASLLPMVTDPLIVTSSIALEAGRYALNKTGKKGDYSFETPLLPPGSELPLFTPGKVLKMQAAIPWYGVVMGVSLGAQLSNNTCIVRQQVSVERHFV